MAKQIKAVKCPQCGSIKKEQLKEDHFRCKNCGAEYFLDNDDININIQHRNPANQLQPARRNRMVVIALAAAFLFMLLPLLIGIFSGNNNSGTSISPVKEETKQNIQEFFVLEGNDGKPVIAFKIKRMYYNRKVRKPDDYILRFYNPIQDKVLKDIPMKDWNQNTRLYHHRIFSDGNCYLIPSDEPAIYKMDGKRQAYAKVNGDFFNSIPAFGSGIASLEFRSASYGDGLEIMTNDGTNYYYYPLAKKIYKGREELDEAAKKYENDLTMPTKVYYTFTDKSFDYKKEKIQLIKFWYRERPGELKSIPTSPSWRKKMYMPKKAGIYKGNFKYTKVLFSSRRITDFKDLTPGRLYFEPEIVYQNNDELFITGLPNANPNGNKFLQKIDTQSGKVIWTYKPAGTDCDFVFDFFKFTSGIAFNIRGKENGASYDKLVLLHNDGKVMKEIDLRKLFN